MRPRLRSVPSEGHIFSGCIAKSIKHLKGNTITVCLSVLLSRWCQNTVKLNTFAVSGQMVRFSLNMSILCMTKIIKGFTAKHREIIARPYMKKTKEKKVCLLQQFVLKLLASNNDVDSHNKTAGQTTLPSYDHSNV